MRSVRELRTLCGHCLTLSLRIGKVIRNNLEIIIPSSEIRHNDIVIIKPGDKIPVDGIITEGETTIDESLITGESIPLSKKTGDKVIGGSVNQTYLIKFKAIQIGSETVLAQIIKMVETAQNSKAPGTENRRQGDWLAGGLGDRFGFGDFFRLVFLRRSFAFYSTYLCYFRRGDSLSRCARLGDTDSRGGGNGHRRQI